MQQATEFWRLPVVKRRVGLSKSEIHWRSDDVAQWQDRAMGV